MEPEPITALAPRAAGRTVFTQRWSELAFLHWAVPPERVAHLLPTGTRPDTLDGATYVGLIPFWMQGIGFLGGPGLPWVGSFHETNVRLYSVDEQGRRGVVFLSLDASRLAPVLAARWGAPAGPAHGSRSRSAGRWRPVRSSTSSRHGGDCTWPTGPAAPATGPTSTRRGRCTGQSWRSSTTSCWARSDSETWSGARPTTRCSPPESTSSSGPACAADATSLRS